MKKPLISNLQKKFYVVRSPVTTLYLALIITTLFKLEYKDVNSLPINNKEIFIIHFKYY